ncbi:MAG: MFS transporter, partial [Rickettsia endosymbiont of Labidopullus appendiculatus]|nr:MFS transporter [Rickettsia endosymbiont of Labidopullus appendiculatus]
CFILGGSTGIVGVYLRRYSNMSQRAIEQKSYPSNVILNNKYNILRISIISGFSYMTYVIPFVVMNSFVPLITSISLEAMMSVNTLLLIVDAAMIPLIGHFVKKYCPVDVMIVSTSILFISIVPLWLYMTDASVWYVNFVRLWIIALGVTFLCPLNYWLNSLFHGSDKYMLVSIGDALGTSIFGRSAPAVCIALWHFTDSSISIGVYIAMIALATIWAVKSR